MFLKPQQLHFTGIGGIGMSGIAEILLNLGYQITGSDVKLSPITDRLASLGAKFTKDTQRKTFKERRRLL